LQTLDARARRVLDLRFGLSGSDPQTLQQIGEGLGITRERVRQIATRALDELRAVAPDLAHYLTAE
jgi:RNA polymerase primary sigma factor